MIDDIIKKIAPTGVLRVGVNMSNFLLVNSKDKLGVIDGVSPGIGKKLAKHWKGTPKKYTFVENCSRSYR